MNFRNPRYTANGTIDMEIEHPEYGWVPFTASETDPEAYGRELYGYAVSSGDVLPFEEPDASKLRAALGPLSSRQIRLTLLNIGITEAMVDEKLAGDALGTIEWKHATQFERLHPLIEALAVAFALQPEQVDDLWTWALQL